MGNLAQDLRFAVRTLARLPAFAITAVAVVALGIGATTAMFSAVDALLLRPLPLPDPDRLVDVVEVTPEGEHAVFTYVQYVHLRERTHAVDLAAWSHERLNLRTIDGVEPIHGAIATGNYFNVLGATPVRGRFFGPADDRQGDPEPVAVLSHGTWRRRFGSDESVVGRSISLNGVPVTIIGVASERFTGATIGISPEVWVPITLAPRLKSIPSLLDDRQIRYYQLVGRLGDGTRAEHVSAALSFHAEEPAADQSVQGRIRVYPTTGLPRDGRGGLVRFLALLFTTSALVLLIAGTNVAGMLLARAAGRRKEIAIRLALGASRIRLIRQLLTESAVLFVVGGATGLLVAHWLIDLIVALTTATIGAVVIDLRLDFRVLAFTVGLSLAAGVAFGLAPALQGTRSAPVADMKEASASSPRRTRLLSGAVVAQVALSVLLLIAAGLFVRALQNAASVDPGFEVDGLVVATFDFRLNGYDVQRGQELLRTLRSELEGMPDIESTALSHAVPLGRMNWAFAPLELPGHPDSPPGQGLRANMNWVDPPYFRTMRIPIVRGRGFTAADTAEAPQVAVVSQTVVRRLWGDRDPLGTEIRVGGVPLRIIGVAQDVQDRDLGQTPGIYVYRPLAQTPSPVVAVLARTKASETELLSAVRSAVRSLDPNAPLMNAAVFRERIAASFLPQRIAGIVTGLFGVTGLCLAAVGLYGLVSYSVTQRAREIAIRMAVGARRLDVQRMAMRDGLALVAIGSIAGAAAALALTRLLASLIFGVSTTDPVVFLSVITVLFTVALFATYIPARRGTRVDPMLVLRSE